MATLRISLRLVLMCIFGAVLALTLAACQPILIEVQPEKEASVTPEPDSPTSGASFVVLQVAGEDQQGKDRSIVYTVDADFQGNFDIDTFQRLTQTYTDTTRLESLLVCDSRTRTWTMYVNEMPPSLDAVKRVSEHVVLPNDRDNNVREIVNGRMFDINSSILITSAIETTGPGDLATVVPQLAQHFSELTGLPLSSTRVMPKAATTALLVLSSDGTDQPSSPSRYIVVPFVNVDAQCNEQAPGGVFDCKEWCSDCIQCGWYCAFTFCRQ